MTAAARKRAEPVARPSPLAVFTARCEARALLWQAEEFDLPDAVDALQAAAIASGLIAELGQDEVQRLMATAFHAVRGDRPKSGDKVPAGNIGADFRRSLVPASTIMAAEYLVREGDVARLRAWLAKHTDEDCAAILSHIERKTAP